MEQSYFQIQLDRAIKEAERLVAYRPKVSGGNLFTSSDFQKTFVNAEKEAKQMGDQYVSVEHLFLALLKYPNQAMKEIFKEYGINRERFLQALLREFPYPNLQMCNLSLWDQQVL